MGFYDAGFYSGATYLPGLSSRISQVSHSSSGGVHLFRCKVAATGSGNLDLTTPQRLAYRLRRTSRKPASATGALQASHQHSTQSVTSSKVDVSRYPPSDYAPCAADEFLNTASTSATSAGSTTTRLSSSATVMTTLAPVSTTDSS